MRQVLDIRLADADADKVRRSTTDAIKELQDLPASSIRVIRNLQVTAPGNITVAHRLGRAPQFVGVSAIRFLADEAVLLTAGTVYDRPTHAFGADQTVNRDEVVVLAFVGFSATAAHLTFDLTVF